MRNEVEKCTQALIEAIRESKEYKEFEKSKTAVAEHPELRGQIDEFRKKIYLLQNSDTSIDLFGEMNRLFVERQELRRNTVISRYLTTELRMCRMLQSISMEVMNVTDLEIDGFEDAIFM